MSTPTKMMLQNCRRCRVLTFLFTIFVLFVKFSEAAPQGSQNYEVCQTTRCREVANNLMQDMNTSVNPCDDFYQYMCGGFVKNNPIRRDQIGVSKLLFMKEKTATLMREMLEGPTKDDATRAYKQAKDIYQMCIDTDTLDRLGVTPLVNIVANMGGWSIIMNSESSRNIQWQEIFQNLLRTFLPSGLGILQVSADIDSESSVIYLYKPSFALPLRTYRNPNTEENQLKLSAYRRYIKAVAESFAQTTGSNVSDEDIHRDVEELLAFEIQLANSTFIKEDTNVVANMKAITIDELQQKCDEENPQANIGKINWLSILRNTFSTAGVEIDGSQKIVVASLNFMRHLSHVLDQVSHRTIANYLQWTFIQRLLPYTGGKMTDIKKQFVQATRGISKEKERWQLCTVTPNMYHAIFYEYARTHFPTEVKEAALGIVENLKKTMKNKITEAQWMDEETKATSLDKLASITSNIGSPKWYNDTAINDYYNGVNVTSVYLESILNLVTYNGIKRMKTLMSNDIDEEFLAEPKIEVTGFYNDVLNYIYLPIGFLQDPVFDISRPNVMNYGGLGMVVGHEIFHAFDETGRGFDKHGNPVYWWTDFTTEKYENISSCFVDQYDQYVLPDFLEINKTVYVNGQWTVNENIGDFNGITAAYQAYKQWLNTSGEKEIRLPGFEQVTDDQLFFMSFANVYCEKDRLQALQWSMVHAPWSVRIRGSLSNSPKFSEAFNCPAGSPMNPEKKCSLF